MEKIRLGLVGYGNMGSSHVANWLKGAMPAFTLTAVCDRKPARLEACREALGDDADRVRYFDTYEEMLAAKVADAILIATPHYDHPPMAIAALEHGYHVMVEKPAGVYTSAVRAMNETAKRHPDLVFGMMFNQRTNPVYKKMKAIVASGEMGPIRRTNWLITNWYRSQSYYDSGSWRATWAGEGGGVLLNQCPHNLDLWQWICGMPVRLQAMAHEGMWHDIEVEDDVSCYAKYANGATGVFITSTGDTPGTNRFEIMLDGGKLVAYEDRLEIHRLETPNSAFNASYTGGFGEPKSTIEVYHPDEANPQHVGVMNAFGEAILHGAPLVAGGEEGLNGLMISNAMHLSAWTGEMVELPIDEAKFKALLDEKRAHSNYDPDDVTGDRTFDTEGTY